MNLFTVQSKSRIGESYVRLLYEKSNYRVLEQNFRRVGTELDLVVYRDKTIIFVEVKLRKNFQLISLLVSDLISYKKQQALRRGAQFFLQEAAYLDYENIRFDLCVLGYTTKKTLLKINKVKQYKDFMFGIF